MSFFASVPLGCVHVRVLCLRAVLGVSPAREAPRAALPRTLLGCCVDISPHNMRSVGAQSHHIECGASPLRPHASQQRRVRPPAPSRVGRLARSACLQPRLHPPRLYCRPSL
eukprot:739329-Prymnesium_polylepis.1